MIRKTLMAFIVSIALLVVPSFAYAYTLENHKMDSQMWYNASDYFTDLTRANMRQAMSEWNAHIPEYRGLCYNPATHNQSQYDRTQDGQNRIYKHPDGDDSTLATNYWWYWTNTGIIYESDIVVNSRQSWTNGAAPGAHDIKSVMKHELGHTLGLGHSSFWIAVMLPTLPDNTVRCDLKSDDLGALAARYS